MSERPDKKQVKNLIKRAQSIDAGFKTAVDSEKSEIASVKAIRAIR